VEELEEEVSALARAAEEERQKLDKYRAECMRLEDEADSLQMEIEEREGIVGRGGVGEGGLKEEEVAEMEAEAERENAVAQADERARLANDKVVALTSLLSESEKRSAEANAACERAKEGEADAKRELRLLGSEVDRRLHSVRQAEELIRAAEEAKGHAEQQVLSLKADLERASEERDRERGALERRLDEAVKLAGQVIDEERAVATTLRREVEEARGEAESLRAGKEGAEEDARRARDVAKRQVDVRCASDTTTPQTSRMHIAPMLHMFSLFWRVVLVLAAAAAKFSQWSVCSRFA
jgi:chromosome segregation ATPase